MPDYVADYYQENGPIGEGVLQMYFNLTLKQILVLRSRSSRLVGKFRGNVVVGVWPVIEGVDGGDRVSSNHKKVLHEIFMVLIKKFGSPWENACVIQCGRRCVDLGELKGFSRFFQRLVLIQKV